MWRTFLFCFNFRSASRSLKVGENVAGVSNSLDPEKLFGVSSGSKLFAYGSSVVIGRLRVGITEIGLELSSLEMAN